LDLEVRGKALYSQGKPLRVAAVRDVTERKALGGVCDIKRCTTS